MPIDQATIDAETIRYLLAENARLIAELVAAQAVPAMAWQETKEGWYSVGFFLSVDPDEGWRAEMSDGWGHVRLVASGREVGSSGKEYCEATRASVFRRVHKLITDSAGALQVRL